MSDVQETLLAGGSQSAEPQSTPGSIVAPAGESIVTDPNAPAFHGQLRPDLKGHKSLLRFENPSDLAQAYVEVEERLGRSVEIPGENATVDERSRYNALLRGGIETPDAYDFAGAKLPEGVTLTDGGMTELRKLAFDNGWTNAQAVNAVEWDARRQQEAVSEVKKVMQQTRRDSELTLRQEWGTDYDQNILRAQKVVQTHGSEEFNKLLNSTGIGNHPEFVRMLSKIGAAVGEGELPSGARGTSTKAVSSFPGAAAAAERHRQGN